MLFCPWLWGSKAQPSVPGGGCRESGVSLATWAISAPALVLWSSIVMLSPTVFIWLALGWGCPARQRDVFWLEKQVTR